jgi:hypothetical protein
VKDHEEKESDRRGSSATLGGLYVRLGLTARIIFLSLVM